MAGYRDTETGPKAVILTDRLSVFAGFANQWNHSPINNLDFTSP